jgi:hypothetical protein
VQYWFSIGLFYTASFSFHMAFATLGNKVLTKAW